MRQAAGDKTAFDATLGRLLRTKPHLNNHPIMTTPTHLLMAASSRKMDHVTEVQSSQTGFMSSLHSNPTVTGSQSYWVTFGARRHSHHGSQQLCDAVMSI